MNYREPTIEERIEKLKKSMTLQKCDTDKEKAIEKIRESYINTGIAILLSCPQSRNLSIAITSLEDSLHRAIKSIVLGE